MDADSRIYETILQLKRQNARAALVVVVGSEGSAPRKAGAKMLVQADGVVIGSIGGGRLEADMIRTALDSLPGGAAHTVCCPLKDAHGLACGGTVWVYIEPILPAPALIILGAGHVGRAVCRLAAFTGFDVTVIDDRQEFANREKLPEAGRILVSEFAQAFEQLTVDEHTGVLIATRGHQHDLVALERALQTTAGYIGLLGSRRKKASFFEGLSQKGFSDDAIRRVHVPVGLDIGAVTPEEIAVSIMAQIIQHRRNGDT